jgi:aminoglycoside phosphotransferase (APT) family kinase protein
MTQTPMNQQAVPGGEGLTPDYLTAALANCLGRACVTAAEVTRVGTGQVSDSFRVCLTYDRPADPGQRPATLVAKVPAADPASRNAARTFRTYELEASFYGQLAADLPVSLPACYFAAYDPGPDEYVVLLEDLAPACPGNQLAGITPDQAGAAVDELAALHAAGWGSETLAALPWLNRSSPEGAQLMTAAVTGLYPGFRDRYAQRLEPETMSLIERFLPVTAAYLEARDVPATIVHGDFRADNLLFGRSRPVVLDWQTCSYGAGLSDLSYFLASSLQVTDRRRHEDALVRRYHAGLAAGGVGLSWTDCWNDYRRYAFSGIVMDIVAAMFVQQTERGDEMFAAMANRHARHALDLSALDLLR